MQITLSLVRQMPQKQCAVDLSGVCSAAAELPSPHSYPPIALCLTNPLSPPAADKEQCIAAFTLCSSGR